MAEYLGLNVQDILVPTTILLSTVIGATIAIITVISQRGNARLKNSMDFINSYNEDNDISIALNEVINLKKKPSSVIEKMATSEGICIETGHIRTVLNYYESMSICINHKIYDDAIIKEAVFTTVLDVWTICAPYIKERRKHEGKATYYQELDLLIKKWLKKPLKKKQTVKT